MANQPITVPSALRVQSGSLVAQGLNIADCVCSTRGNSAIKTLQSSETQVGQLAQSLLRSGSNDQAYDSQSLRGQSPGRRAADASIIRSPGSDTSVSNRCSCDQNSPRPMGRDLRGSVAPPGIPSPNKWRRGGIRGLTPMESPAPTAPPPPVMATPTCLSLQTRHTLPMLPRPKNAPPLLSVAVDHGRERNDAQFHPHALTSCAVGSPLRTRHPERAADV